ncbi:MAG: hypothetical protein BWY17_03155 [Deltaproteobacteria bacterium ADurb.Bin207]|nr:MAG: hypothetical protein BWY17_03155 [Deltaproteobacteria bacterium ADurb.Bin207]
MHDTPTIDNPRTNVLFVPGTSSPLSLGSSEQLERGLLFRLWESKVDLCSDRYRWIGAESFFLRNYGQRLRPGR